MKSTKDGRKRLVMESRSEETTLKHGNHCNTEQATYTVYNTENGDKSA